jgi:hypothetical protein
MAAPRLRIPGLQKRAGRRQKQKRQSDRDGEQDENSGGWVLVSGRFPGCGRHNRQKEKAQDKHAQVNFPRSRGWQPSQDVSVRVAQQVQDLEKDERGYPDSRASSEPWKNDFREHGLNLKKQKGADKDSRCP